MSLANDHNNQTQLSKSLWVTINVLRHASAIYPPLYSVQYCMALRMDTRSRVVPPGYKYSTTRSFRFFLLYTCLRAGIETFKFKSINVPIRQSLVFLVLRFPDDDLLMLVDGARAARALRMILLPLFPPTS
eukprot:6188801-Pleurochrysis_carterae.AAC.4